MFAHICYHVPEARTVSGNSWMYNLEAYRRLYPPQYTATLPISEEDEFQYLALWGQCFDRDWNPKKEIAQVLVTTGASQSENSAMLSLAGSR
jgi:hypothetical protein